ncbi:MAG TPA: thrombospondin type-1 domain-containing protein [Candidatus Paceibacterota bacterium]|nr:thrombospondin type-1 domain-containing protein [Candidatus Paceibacterota bacterium]
MMSAIKKGINVGLAIIFAFASFIPFTASAASSYTISANSSLQITEWSVCKNVTNSNTKSLFVPTNTSAEWTAFQNNPGSGVTVGVCYTYSWQTGSWGSCSVSCGGGTQSRSVWCQRSDGTTVADSFCTGTKPSTSQSCNTQSCCVSYQGQSCSNSNSCGTNYGTYQCDGSCNASTPYVPPNYGQSCSNSNVCGTNYGTIDCSGSCNASSPYVPPNYGQGCTSSANSCGQTSNGSITCSGSCSASTPSNPSYYGQSCSACTGMGCNYGTYNCSQSCVNPDGSSVQGPFTCWSSPGACNFGLTNSYGQCGAAPSPSNYGQSCSVCNGAGCNYGTYGCTGCVNSDGSAVQAPTYCWSSPGGCIYGTTNGYGVCQAQDPSYYGQSCSSTSGQNACGETQTCTGTLNCANQCSASTCNPPANSCTFSWQATPTSCNPTWYDDGSSCGPNMDIWYQYYDMSYTCVRSTDGAAVDPSYCGAQPTQQNVCNATCRYVY